VLRRGGAEELSDGEQVQRCRGGAACSVHQRWCRSADVHDGCRGAEVVQVHHMCKGNGAEVVHVDVQNRCRGALRWWCRGKNA